MWDAPIRNSAAVLFISVIGMSAASNAATLVARYEFESAGNLGADSSGNSNTLDSLGTVTQGAGEHGQGAHFSGVSDFGGASVLKRTTGLTGYDGLPGASFTAWVNLDSD